MVLLFVLIAVPVVVGVAAYFFGKRKITTLEAVIQIGVVAALVIAGYYLFRWVGVQDYEVWNGRIASKHSGTSRCCHSYDCNCRDECSGSGKDRTCRRVCDTCYEHASDTYYRAVSTNDEEVYYSGCWEPGSSSPPRYDAIRVGEPTAWEHRYTNYVRAAPEELVPADPSGGRFAEVLPPYPRPSGWRARRFLFVGIDHPDAAGIDQALDELNADLGAAKQVNLIVVVASEKEPAYFDALRATWLGGKKNDVVLVIGAPRFPEIQWVRVMAWNVAAGVEDEFKGNLVSRVEALGSFDGAAVLAALRDEVERRYQRRSFSELEYLMARARPPGWAVAVLFGVGLCLSSLLAWIFWRNQRRMRGRAPHERVRAFLQRLGMLGDGARYRTWWEKRLGDDGDAQKDDGDRGP